jgi:hypothetical protein
MSGQHSVHHASPKHRTLSVKADQETSQTVTLTLREEMSNVLIGYVEITLVPTGARVSAWNADDSDIDGQLIVHAERPS